MIAHVGGVPVEEALLPFVTWVGAALVLTRTWVASRVRRRPPPAARPPSNTPSAGGG